MNKKMQYVDRADYCQNQLSRQLFQLMDRKKSNLALSADVTNSEDLLALTERLGPELCVLKTHIDIIKDFTPELTNRLVQLSQQHDFLIFEDRKFADIGNTVKNQYQGGVYHIADWAHIVNAHALPGAGIIQGLAEVGLPKNRGLLMLAEMSSADNLLDETYAQKTLAMAEAYPEFVIGFISQHQLNANPAWIYMTPGVSLADSNDPLGQRYITPDQAIIENGTDIIIVGRGILKAKDPLQMAKQYRAAGWRAYLKSIAI